MRAPSLHHLRLFMLVAESRSFTRAAAAANLSQPALSRTIRLLEDDLGTRLFDRTSRSVLLSVAGEGLLVTARRLVAEYDEAFTDYAAALKGTRGRVAVGALPSVAAVSLPKVLAKFRQMHPEIDITIHEGLSASLVDQLAARQIDLAITTRLDERDELAFLPLFDDELQLVVHRQEAARFAPQATWAALAGQPFIAMAPASSVRQMTDAAQIQACTALHPLYECSHLATVGGLVASGLGLSALPRSVAPMMAMYTDLRWLPFVGPKTLRTIGIVHLRHRELSPSASLLMDLMLASITQKFPYSRSNR